MWASSLFFIMGSLYVNQFNETKVREHLKNKPKKYQRIFIQFMRDGFSWDVCMKKAKGQKGKK